jgi:hypothetical protein
MRGKIILDTARTNDESKPLRDQAGQPLDLACADLSPEALAQGEGASPN